MKTKFSLSATEIGNLKTEEKQSARARTSPESNLVSKDQPFSREAMFNPTYRMVEDLHNEIFAQARLAQLLKAAFANKPARGKTLSIRAKLMEKARL